MPNNKIKQAIAAVIAIGISTGTAIADTKKDDSSAAMVKSMSGIEKCYGIAKAGMNDCGTANHNCSGEAKVDGAKDEWLAMPNALCKRIVGGSTKSS